MTKTEETIVETKETAAVETLPEVSDAVQGERALPEASGTGVTETAKEVPSETSGASATQPKEVHVSLDLKNADRIVEQLTRIEDKLSQMLLLLERPWSK